MCTSSRGDKWIRKHLPTSKKNLEFYFCKNYQAEWKGREKQLHLEAKSEKCTNKLDEGKLARIITNKVVIVKACREAVTIVIILGKMGRYRKCK